MSQVWFVTGADSGIGTGISRAAWRAGDRIVATGRNLEKMRKVFPDVALENSSHFAQLSRRETRLLPGDDRRQR